MISTFMGLETAKRGLSTSQGALYTTGNNVANANTLGYSRQRVNLVQTSGFPTVGLNSPRVAGQIGTGVAAETVQRIRDSFLDAQFRTQSNKIGFYGAMSESLSKMEGIMNEPTDSGLAATMEKFWNSLQGLTANTENSGAREVVASTGVMVADTLNYYYKSLTSVQTDIGNQINVKANEINTLISSIDQLNQQISKVEPHGYIPNDLYDKRDVLVDQLSQLVSIKVNNVIPTDYGRSSDVAAGLYNIELMQEEGSSYVPPINLVSVNQTGMVGTSKVEVSYDKTTGMVDGVKLGSKTMTDYKFSGELSGLINNFGYKKDDGTIGGAYPDMLKKLDNMTTAFVNEFNSIHKQGYALGDSDASTLDFFEIEPGKSAAQSIKVNSEIVKDPSKIAAGAKSGGASGDNENAKLLADLKKKAFSEYSTKDQNSKELTGSFDTYYSGIIGKLGVDSQSAQKNLSNSVVLATSVNQNRDSVSSVSLDEEMTDMIRFQQAYNASARMMTMMDEMLDKIINGMGTVGR
ncbi:flagellar hook-associated protein FlgK [Peribacillus simplex]|uniref:Flagellar hook-associated protein 1 n=1 Tax=Peribacillus simplex TaxID=1478 RepID=A0AAW7I7B3_9BACI|nr:flagellar hook-associated protein FlgK [Peribacillus simplex]MDM5451415.1 flagellar hook-associated protein FlgK [Peribacillus simplex]